MFRPNNKSYNSFKVLKYQHKDKDKSNDVINKQMININDKDLFPDLSTTHKVKEPELTTAFKDIITNADKSERIIDEHKDNKMEVFIDDNGNTVYRYGTQNTKSLKNNDVTANHNDVMNKVIMALNKNTQKYMDVYDSIHGEGAYNEKYASIMYPNECYDTEYSDTEMDTTDEDGTNY
jgi:hypothetical protein